MMDSDTSSTPLTWGLLDAEAQHLAHPDAFPIPSEPERNALKPGDQVRLIFVLEEDPLEGPNAERMWVEVTQTSAEGLQGRLTAPSTVIADLPAGVVLEFEPRHVAGIALGHHEVTFAVDQRAVATHRALAQARPPAWVTHDDPVDEIDSGWTLYSGTETEDDFGDDPASTTQAVTLAELAQRYPALVEVFQAGSGDWVYRADHRRYVRAKPVEPDAVSAGGQPASPDPEPADPEPV